MLSQMIAQMCDVRKQALNASIDIALHRVSLCPQYVWRLVPLHEEVPYEGWAHLLHELPLLVFALLLLLLLLALAFALLSPCQVSFNDLLHICNALALETFKHDVVLNVLDNVRVDIL